MTDMAEPVIDAALPEEVEKYKRHLNTIYEALQYGPITHSTYGFPLKLRYPVYPAHPAFSGSSTQMFRHMGNDLRDKNVLDLGTGSGILGIVAAFRGAQVVALDNDSDAVDLARENVGQNNMNERVRLSQSDLFNALDPERDAGKFDVICANLWFPAPEEMWKEQRAQVLAVYKRFLTEYKNYLKPDGIALLSSGSAADIAATEALLAEHHIRSQKKSARNSYNNNTVHADWHVYGFDRDGGAAPI